MKTLLARMSGIRCLCGILALLVFCPRAAAQCDRIAVRERQMLLTRRQAMILSEARRLPEGSGERKAQEREALELGRALKLAMVPPKPGLAVDPQAPCRSLDGLINQYAGEADTKERTAAAFAPPPAAIDENSARKAAPECSEEAAWRRFRALNDEYARRYRARELDAAAIDLFLSRGAEIKTVIAADPAKACSLIDELHDKVAPPADRGEAATGKR